MGVGVGVVGALYTRPRCGRKGYESLRAYMYGRWLWVGLVEGWVEVLRYARVRSMFLPQWKRSKGQWWVVVVAGGGGGVLKW